MDFSTQQLRQQILSLAIQGKLVPQIASEEKAKDLMQKIEKERKKNGPKRDTKLAIPTTIPTRIISRFILFSN